MLTMACVLKSGGIYDARWVAKLKAGVAAHLTMAHRFVCLSDVEVPCERIPLEHDWPGWWSKIELFRQQGPLLYFDLDTLIVGDLTDIALRALDPLGGFTILQDFYRPRGFGSGLMAWDAGLGTSDVRRWYDNFRADPEGWIEKCGVSGDQNFIERQETRSTSCWQTAHCGYLAGQIVSYKVHCRNGIPAGARVVCLHGSPKFPDMSSADPVRQAWEQAA